MYVYMFLRGIFYTGLMSSGPIPFTSKENEIGKTLLTT